MDKTIINRISITAKAKQNNFYGENLWHATQSRRRLLP